VAPQVLKSISITFMGGCGGIHIVGSIFERVKAKNKFLGIRSANLS
jgi:hypothetical protein